MSSLDKTMTFLNNRPDNILPHIVQQIHIRRRLLGYIDILNKLKRPFLHQAEKLPQFMPPAHRALALDVPPEYIAYKQKAPLI